MTEHQHSKFVKIVFAFKEGDLIKIDPFYGRPFNDNKLRKIIKIHMYQIACSSGVMVEVEGYDGELDSDWILK